MSRIRFGIMIGAVALFVGTTGSAQTPTALGSEAEAKWTRSTIASATARPNKKLLAEAQTVTVVGEVIDVSCYVQLGKFGPDHAACAASCIRNGSPAGILDPRGNVVLLMAEQHDPRRDGEVSLAEKLAGLASQQVAATGLMTENGGVRVVWLRAPAVEKAEAPAMTESAPEAAPAAAD